MENSNKPFTPTHDYPKTSHEIIDDIVHVLQLHYDNGNCRVECYNDLIAMLRELQWTSMY
jgi:hypothetical protein